MGKYLGLLIRMNREEPISTTFYLIMLFLVSFVVNFSIASMEGAKYGYRLLHNYEEGIQFAYYLDVEEELYPYIEEKITRLDGVESMGVIKNSYFFTEGGHTQISIFQYNDALLQQAPFQLKAGRWFLNKDEIVLTESARTQFKLGDEILIKQGDGVSRSIKIIGFLENNLLISGNVAADRNMSKPELFFENSIVDTYQHNLSMGMISGILSPDCDLTGLSKTTTCYLKPDKGVNGEKMMEQLYLTAGEYGHFFEMKEPMGKYWESYLKLENREEYFFLSCILILFITGFCVNNVLRLYNKKWEFSIYYMFGLTWEGSVLLSCMKSLLLFVIAIPIGSILLRLGKARGVFLDLIISWKVEVLIFAALLAGYLLFCLPVYLIFRKKDPIELLKREDGI